VNFKVLKEFPKLTARLNRWPCLNSELTSFYKKSVVSVWSRGALQSIGIVTEGASVLLK